MGNGEGIAANRKHLVRMLKGVTVGKTMALFVLAMIAAVSVSCISVVPVNEYNLARTAMDSARESEAARFAPALWYKAELAYREGEALFRERDYGAARLRFEASRVFAEQSESAARVGRVEAGETGF